MIDNSLLTGTYLRTILSQNAELMNVISADKIFPIIAPPDTTYPLITYTRDNAYPQYTKAAPCGGWTNSIQITYKIYTGTYHDLGEEIANKLRNALEWAQYKDNNIEIHPIELLSATEFFNDDSYCQQLTFNITVE